jgi:hypothetical protein
MVLENVWNVFGWSALVAAGPIFVSSLLSTNPFTGESPKGWAFRYTRDSKNPDHPRSKPFAIPVWLATLLYVIVGGCLVVPLFTIHYNSGAYDGWAVRPLPIAFTLISLGLNALWMVVYLSKCNACTNIEWIQMVSIFSSVMGFVYMLDNTKLIYAIWGIPFIAWNVLWFAKAYVEDWYRCGYKLDAQTKCNLLSTFSS